MTFQNLTLLSSCDEGLHILNCVSSPGGKGAACAKALSLLQWPHFHFQPASKCCILSSPVCPRFTLTTVLTIKGKKALKNIYKEAEPAL